MEIENSVILITGGAARVGRGIGLALAGDGAHIAFTYFDDHEPWQKTQSEIEALGVQSLALPLDIRDSEQVHAVIKKVADRFGKIDVLVNNASGPWVKKPFMEITQEEWDLTLDINLRGPFFCAQAVAPIMLSQGYGLIVNISDMSAFQVWPGYSHHSCSKAAQISLTKSLAAELAPQVRVNAIAPGTILLPPDPTPEKIKWATENSLLKKVGSPNDVAKLIRFLIDCDFVTGSVYLVDGGRSLV